MRAVSLPVSPVARNRKDSTPRHGRLLHPSSWAERDNRDHAAENFFQGGSPKTGHPISPPGPPHRQKSFRPNFRGWGLDENLKPKSPPPPGSHIEVRRQDKMRLASRLVPPHAAHPPRRLHPALRSRCAPCNRSSLYGLC